MTIAVDWEEALLGLRRRRMTDARICALVIAIGVQADRSTLTRLRLGRAHQPRYPLGAALLSIIDGRPRPVRVDWQALLETLCGRPGRCNKAWAPTLERLDLLGAHSSLDSLYRLWRGMSLEPFHDVGAGLLTLAAERGIEVLARRCGSSVHSCC